MRCVKHDKILCFRRECRGEQRWQPAPSPARGDVPRPSAAGQPAGSRLQPAANERRVTPPRREWPPNQPPYGGMGYDPNWFVPPAARTVPSDDCGRSTANHDSGPSASSSYDSGSSSSGGHSSSSDSGSSSSGSSSDGGGC